MDLFYNIYRNLGGPTRASQITAFFSFRVSPKITQAISFCSLPLAFIIASPSFSQKLPVLKSHTYNISIRDGDDFRKGRWNIDPKVNPDVYEAPMAINQQHKLVTFITDVDSLQLRVEKGKTYSFVILVNEKDSAFTQVKAVPSPVTFTKEYMKSHQGKTFVELPASNWFEYNGFKEAQAHVNFPYRNGAVKNEFSSQALHVKDGNIVFTELNHNFIGPEGQKLDYQNKLNEAFSNLTMWLKAGFPAERGYNNTRACFDEYMNWALVCLRYVDYAPPLEQAQLIAKMEKYQVEVRGFTKFAEFDQFLIGLYKNRRKGQVVADLYPQIVEWFVKNK